MEMLNVSKAKAHFSGIARKVVRSHKPVIVRVPDGFVQIAPYELPQEVAPFPKAASIFWFERPSSIMLWRNTMNRWDVVFLRTEEKERDGHPAVVPVSVRHPRRSPATAVQCHSRTKKQPAEQARQHHVILDDADGLEFPTLVDCSLVYVARKASILRSTGSVTSPPAAMQRLLRGYLGLG